MMSKKLSAVLALIFFASLFAQAEPVLQSLDCQAVNALGVAHLVFDPASRQVRSYVNGLTNPIVYTGAFFEPVSQSSTQTTSRVFFHSPSESIMSYSVGYQIRFDGIPRENAVTTLTGNIFRMGGLPEELGPYGMLARDYRFISVVNCKIGLVSKGH